MSLKKREFRNFCQGHRTVAEYIDEFNKLSRYAPDDVDTDAKRRERFMDGQNNELAIQLSVVYTPNYQALLDKATILENKQAEMENRKRKNNHGKFDSGSHKRPHISYEDGDSSRYNQHEGHHHHHDHNGNGNIQHVGNGHFHQGNMNRMNFNKKDISQILCYNCKKPGHYAADCPEKKKNGGGFNGNKPNPFNKGHMNHINVEEVFEAPNAANSKF
jgi:hypothetical protein